MRRPRLNSILLIPIFFFFAGRSFAQGPVQFDLENGLVNLLAEDVTFGEVLNTMALKKDFTMKIPPDVGAKRISIRLYNVDLDRAVTRLFFLVQERNYSVKYHPNGEISHIDVIKGKNAAPRSVQTGRRGRSRSEPPRRPPVPRARRPQRYRPSEPRDQYEPQYIPPQTPERGMPPMPFEEGPEYNYMPPEEMHRR